MQGKKSNAEYCGYASCPAYTGDNKLMLMEFKYGGEPDMTFFSNQQKPSRLFYHFKRDLFARAYWWIMPQGWWYGKHVVIPPKYGEAK
eukprot:CAMPEP_0170486232 /NCGR_PEP_ID=MMETSP0208-20121228/5294_1 /TAXON_ID=197538 /ORGANISM="Strombidium inclinatum, Strain S3" /LENGTH=87 /DNA_ID=CAMNT_0010760103 /DNA_START=229 /DNA_END=492 /DNA_ORIENTATION=+